VRALIFAHESVSGGYPGLPARSARVAGQAFLESAAHRRLAAADLLVVLVLGHGAPAILFTPRGAGDSAARLPPRSFAPYNRIVRIYQLMNWHDGNDWAMPNGDPRVFGLPAGSLPGLRFLPIVVPKIMILHGFSARGSPGKFFTLSFPARQGTGEAALPCPASAPFGAAAATGSGAIGRSRRGSWRYSLRRFGGGGALSAHGCRTAPRPRRLVRRHRRTDLAAAGSNRSAILVRQSPSRYG